MRVTINGQVTIPPHIREKLGITPSSEIEFIEEHDRVYIAKKTDNRNSIGDFKN
jgi:AbrB family looped-hinge helix DNA binding protein